MARTWSLPVLPEARAVVRNVWVIEADHEGPDEPMVPYGCMDLLWIARGPVLRLDAGGAVELAGLVLSGQTTQPYALRLAPGSQVLGLGCHPHTGHLLAQAPAEQLTDSAVPWGDVLAASVVSETTERLAETADLTAASILVQRAVARWAGRSGQHAGQARAGHAVRSILAGEGVRSEVSMRYLQRVFADCVGVPPGQLARTVRFLRALPFVAGDRPLTRIAHDLGYHDQAHFSRSFRAMTGVAPSAWRAGDRLVDGFVAGWGGSLPYKPSGDEAPTLEAH